MRDSKRKSNVSCCIFGCKNTYSNTVGVQFYSFPTKKWDLHMKNKWIEAIKIMDLKKSNWKPKRHTKICSDHFIGGRKINHPNSPSYFPTVNLGMEQKLPTASKSVEKQAECSQAHEDIVIKVEPEDIISDDAAESERECEDPEKNTQTLSDGDSAELGDEKATAAKSSYQVCRWRSLSEGLGAKLCLAICTVSGLATHIEDEHISAAKDVSKTCRWENCDRTQPYKNKRDLLRHLNSHALTEKFHCPALNCNQRFCLKEDLEAHKSSHVCEPPLNRYHCLHEGCGRILPSVSHLKQHEATHTNPKLPCPHAGCPKVFRNTTKMNIHYRRYHYGGGILADKKQKVNGARIKVQKLAVCCVDGCSSKEDSREISFHLFPKDPETNAKWRIKLKIDAAQKSMRVCSRHFRATDFFKYQPRANGDERQRLKLGSVPSRRLPA